MVALAWNLGLSDLRALDHKRFRKRPLTSGSCGSVGELSLLWAAAEFCLQNAASAGMDPVHQDDPLGTLQDVCSLCGTEPRAEAGDPRPEPLTLSGLSFPSCGILKKEMVLGDVRAWGKREVAETWHPALPVSHLSSPQAPGKLGSARPWHPSLA